MNQDVRRSARRKRREFILNGRSPRFRSLQKETIGLVKKAKKAWFNGVKEEALNSKNQGYYWAVKGMLTKEEPKRFDVRTLLPGKTDEEICE